MPKYVALVDLAGVAKQGGTVTAAKCLAAGVSLQALIRGRAVAIRHPKPDTDTDTGGNE